MDRNNPHRLVALNFKPLWVYVDAIREFCSFFARAAFDDRTVGQRVAIIVHELVENAIRYGDDDELDLRIERMGETLAVSVENTTTEEQSERLAAVFSKLQATPPQEAYIEALREASDLPAGKSGLGLRRIRFEGGVDLDLSVKPRRVRVTARGVL